MSNPEILHGIRPTPTKASRIFLQLTLAAVACSLCATAMAQQKPLTGHMLDNSRTSTPAQARPAQTAQAPMPDYTNMKTASIQPPPTADEVRPAAFGTPIGGVTHHLLHMQASNQNAVASLPTLGDEASAAYKRYLQSFSHPIPDFFKTMVKSDSGSSQ